MTVFTDDQLRQQLDTVLDTARSQGEVRIRARDGREYAVRPVSAGASSLDVPGVNLNLSAAEIVRFVREGRESAGK